MLIHSPWASLQPYPTFPLPEYLEHAAHRFESKPCLVNMDGTEYTFARIWEAGKRLGRFLQDQGIQKGDRVAVLSANLPEYVVAFQGIAHAGAIVSTLNPLSKQRELLPPLGDCAASAP